MRCNSIWRAPTATASTRAWSAAAPASTSSSTGTIGPSSCTSARARRAPSTSPSSAALDGRACLLVKEDARRLAELHALQRLTMMASRSLDLEVVLERCLEISRELVDAPGAAIYFHD